MKALVLGGSAFVGLRTVKELAARGHDVTVLNRGKTATELPAGVTQHIADRTNNQSMEEALKGSTWDVVYDISGFVMVAGTADLDFLLNLFDGNVGHYIYCSSITAYDSTENFPWHETNDFTKAPPETYGGFKAHVEKALFDRHLKTGFPVTTIRPAAIYGPNNNIYDMEMPMWLRLLQGLPILVPHQGLVVCSYGHVDDLVRFQIEITGREEAFGEAFNLTNEAISVSYYVETLSEIVGKAPNIVHIPESILPEITPSLENRFAMPFSHLFGRAHHSILSIDKATILMDFENEYDFRSGHANAFEWFMENGFADTETSLSDPIWGGGWDFENEAKIAKRITNGA